MHFTCVTMPGLRLRAAALFYCLCLLHLCANTPALAQGGTPFAADINETVVSIPVIVDGKPDGTTMVGTVFKPDGAGPFPFVVLNHGRRAAERFKTPRWRYPEASRWLVRRGFAVFVPTRRGYGETAGPDVESSNNCANPWFKEAMAGGVESVMSVVAYARQQPFVDKQRYIVMGQSLGGYVSVGTGALNPEGLVAVINFAGGHGGRPNRDPGNPCASDKLKEVFAQAGASSRVPSLWIYTENDQYFGPAHSRAWHAAYIAAGGKADYRLLPPFGPDGHTLFVNGARIWQPLVAEFLKSAGF
jgi:dienelactone hydrolase